VGSPARASSIALLAMSVDAASISVSTATITLLRAPLGRPAGLPLWPGLNCDIPCFRPAFYRGTRRETAHRRPAELYHCSRQVWLQSGSSPPSPIPQSGRCPEPRHCCGSNREPQLLWEQSALWFRFAHPGDETARVRQTAYAATTPLPHGRHLCHDLPVELDGTLQPRREHGGETDERAGPHLGPQAGCGPPGA
jgi:hypothetical protein